MFDRNLTKYHLLDTFDRLAGRIELLSSGQRAFVRLFQNVQDFRSIGQTARVHEATIARRLKKIAQRISDDKFISVMASNSDCKIVIGKFVNGKSIRQIAREMGITKYKVGKIVKNTERRTSNIQR